MCDMLRMRASRELPHDSWICLINRAPFESARLLDAHPLRSVHLRRGPARDHATDHSPKAHLPNTSWPTPPRLPALDTNDIHVWKGDVGALAEYGAALGLALDAGELARAARFHHEVDHDRFLISRGLLRALAGHYLDQLPAALTFDTGEFGKPFLGGADAGRLAFNLSHSGDQVLLAFARTGRIGTDVECWSARLGNAERERIASSVFSAGERAALARLPAELRRAAFYAVWTRKEAYIKATGLGISRGLNHFEVSVHPDAAGIQSDSSVAGGVAHWRCFDLSAEPGYSAALVTDIYSPKVVTMTFDASLMSDQSHGGRSQGADWTPKRLTRS